MVVEAQAVAEPPVARAQPLALGLAFLGFQLGRAQVRPTNFPSEFRF